MKKYIILCIAFGIALSAQAQQASMSLKECVDYALKNNVNNKNAKLDQLEAHRKFQEIMGMGLPQINVNAGITDNFKIADVLVPASFFDPKAPSGEYAAAAFGTKLSANAGVSASQLVFDARYLLGVQASKTLAFLQEQNVQRSSTDIIATITKAYYNVLISRQNLKLFDANIQQLEKLMNDTKAMNQQGFAEKLDVDRITVNYNNLKTQLENVKKGIELSELALKYQMGMGVNDPLMLADSLKSFQVDAALTDNAKTDYTNRIEYQMLNTQLTLNNLDKKQVEGQWLPSLYLSASYARDYTHVNATVINTDGTSANYKWFPFNIGSVGLSLQWSLFDGLQKYRLIQEKQIEMLKTQNSMQDLQQGIALQARSARVSLDNALTNYKSQKANVDLANEVYRQAKIKYDNGVGSTLELTTAQTDMVTAENNYLQAYYDALSAQVDLKKALGLLK